MLSGNSTLTDEALSFTSFYSSVQHVLYSYNELVDIKTVSIASCDGIVLLFRDGSNAFSVFCANYKNGKIIEGQIFEKDASRVKECIHGNRLFYLMENLGHASGVWTNGKETITISGDLDFEELKTIIEKIGVRVR